MSEFILEDESAFHCYVDSKQKEAESQGVIFNYEVEGRESIAQVKEKFLMWENKMKIE